MTVGELKVALQDVPDHREIRVFGDPEGNVRWGVGGVRADIPWNDENEEPVHPEDVEEGFYGPDAEIEDFDNVVLITPKHL